MTVPVDHVPDAADRADTPLAAARALLERELAARHARDGGPGLAPPGVVPLVPEVAGPGTRDPWADRRPAATVHLAADAVLLGPWRPAAAEGAGPDGCGTCLAMRWRRLRPGPGARLPAGGGALAGGAPAASAPPGGAPMGGATAGGDGCPPLTPFAVDAVWLTLRALPHARPAAEPGLPQVTRLDLATLLPSTVPLLAEARCPHCARPRRDTAAAAWPDLGPAPVPAVERADPPPEPAPPEAALVNPVCGALGAAPSPPAPAVDLFGPSGPVGPRPDPGGAAGGGACARGATPAAERRRGLLGGLARAAVRDGGRGTAPVLGSYHALVWREGRHAVLDPRRCGEYPPGAGGGESVPRPFDPDRELPWVWGYSLRAGRPVLVPAALAGGGGSGGAGHRDGDGRRDRPGHDDDHGDHHDDDHHDDGETVPAGAGGLATAPRLEEAILRGLVELIEYDALLLAWYAGLPPSRIDPAAGTGPAVRTLLDRAELYGYEVHVFDGRVDLPVPVVTAVAARADGGPGTLAFGSGADFDPERALRTALAGALGPMPRLPARVARRRARLEEAAEDFGRVRRAEDHPLLYGLPRMARHAADYLRPGPALPPAEAFADWAERRPRGGDALAGLHLVRDALAGAGYDALAIDRTTPQQRRMGLRTAATVVPGLLPLDFGWHRQRAPRMAPSATAVRRCPADAVRPPRRAPHPFGRPDARPV